MTLREFEDFCRSTVHDVDKKLERMQTLGELGVSLTGLSGEFGKLQHLHRRFVCYGETPPDGQIRSCLAGMLWYLTRLSENCGTSLSDILALSQKEATERHGKKGKIVP